MSETVPLNDLRRSPTLESDLGALGETVRSGWYVLGEQVAAFENEFSDYLGVTGCAGVGSGTDALILAMRALGIGRGDEILMAANAGMYAAAAAVAVGALPTWIDVSPDRASIDPGQLEARLEASQPSAVVLTHLYGLLADVSTVAAICSAWGVPLIEDCAQAAGASTNGRYAGAWGDVAAFSFYPTKNLGALGDAGAVVSNDRATLERVRALRQYGWTSRYHAEVPGGMNSRMDEIQAAVLRLRLARLDSDNARRRDILSRYAACLPAGVRTFFEDGPSCVAHLAVLAFACEADRDVARERLADLGVSTDVHYPVPDHMQPALGEVARRAPELPITESLATRILTVPCFPSLAESEIQRVCSALRSLSFDGE